MSGAVEANFDGLIGPTHNYAGLSPGNLASTANKNALARPRAAALQGLAKMRLLMGLGMVQGVLPPQERPFIPALRALGYSGSDAQVWAQAWAEEPQLARNAAAASSMWAANAATVSPSADCADGRLHATPANLHTMAHRALEAAGTRRALTRIFADPARFAIHDPLPSHAILADEGAANHMRLAGAPGAAGVEAFVYGRAGEAAGGFAARQTAAACRAVARRHGVGRAVLVEQAPEAIAAGAFHNDVVAVAHETTLFFHAQAFADTAATIEALKRAADGLFEPIFVEVGADAVPLGDAIASYLFNAQLLRLPGAARLTLLVPEEARENAASSAYLAALAAGNGPIGEVRFIDVRESMRNGGGPACLRLRVELTAQERAAITPGFLLTDDLAARLQAWIVRHYREELWPQDLADPLLLDESRAALDALTEILPLGGDFYDFQRA